MAPHPLARRRFIGRKKSAYSPIASGHAGDDHILHDERSHRAAVFLRFVGHHDFPHGPSGDAVQRNEVRVVGNHEHVIAENRHTTVRAE